jgi:hypothetical protein
VIEGNVCNCFLKTSNYKLACVKPEGEQMMMMMMISKSTRYLTWEIT